MQSARGLNNFISVASILRLCKAVSVLFSDPYKNVGKTKVLYIFKIVSVLTFLKIVLLIVLFCLSVNNVFSKAVPEQRVTNPVTFLLVILRRIFLISLTLCNTSSFWREKLVCLLTIIQTAKCTVQTR